MNDNSRNRLSRAALIAMATTAMLAAPAPAPAANLS